MKRRLRSKILPENDRGFILILVLWIAGLLAVLTAHLSVSVRTQIRVTENLTENAKAEALADAGISLAVIDLMASSRSQAHQRRFPINGSVTGCSIVGEGSLYISVTDEAAKIDANSAGIPIMTALFAGLGEPPETATKLAEAIFDFRDRDDDPQSNGTESSDYRAAGLSWTPKNSPLQSLDELGQVYGLTPELLSRLKPHVTIRSGLPGIDASVASKELIALLRNGLAGIASVYGSFPEFHPDVALPAMFVSASHQRFYSLVVAAQTTTGSTFIREAIVDLGARSSLRPVFLRWTRMRNIAPAIQQSSGLATAC